MERRGELPVPRFLGRYAAEASSIGVMRGEVAAVAHECGLRGEELADVRLAVSEAATNAVAQGSAGRPNFRVGVTVGLTDAKMVVDVTTNTARTTVKMSFPIPSAHEALEAALVEQDRMSERFDGAVGTSSELGAYARLQAAGAEVRVRQAQVDLTRVSLD